MGWHVDISHSVERCSLGTESSFGSRSMIHIHDRFQHQVIDKNAFGDEMKLDVIW